MLTLIIIIISIALTIVGVAATQYYFSDTVTDNRIKADVAKYSGESEQIVGAINIYTGRGNEITSSFKLQDLVDQGYLKSIPENWTEYPTALAVPIAGDDAVAESVCFQANKTAGYTFTPDGIVYLEYSKDPSYGIPICSDDLEMGIPCCYSEDS